MAHYPNIYYLQQAEQATGLRYFFISEGNEDVVKAIQYSFIQLLGEKDVYNLGFGDYNIQTDTLNDMVTTNNGDHYRVFNTVLSTIPSFFDQFKGAILMVHGSDGRDGFIEYCKANCSKKCTKECKNYKRRISVYRNYLNKNYVELNVDYQFLGGTLRDNGITTLEDYIPGKEYDSVFLFKRNV